MDNFVIDQLNFYITAQDFTHIYIQGQIYTLRIVGSERVRKVDNLFDFLYFHLLFLFLAVSRHFAIKCIV
jgi:hypothetical protein